MNNAQPLKLYGLKISYFTGKLECYLKYKEIDYQYVVMDYDKFTYLIPRKTGASQMPALELPDGRWMTDSTPIIQWFEQEYTEVPVIPENSVQAFIGYLIEDYADEWLWRSAMHYRWSYEEGRRLLAQQISDETLNDLPGPEWIKRQQIAKRQHTNFVANDGVSKETWNHVESGYLKLLKLLENIFQQRPFIFGDRPSLADFGFFGPFFRHFSIDPTPAAIMREQAPAVYEWVARLWNAKASKSEGGFVAGIPEDLMPLLKEIGETHIELLNANAEAFKQGEERYNAVIQGVEYKSLPTSCYRVWCLEKIQQKYQSLPVDAKSQVESILSESGIWEALWRSSNLNSNFDPDNKLPFAGAREVFTVAERGGETMVERLTAFIIKEKWVAEEAY